MNENLRVSPFKILIIVAILTILGFIIIPKISIRLNPSSTLPSITVNYFWKNASPNSIERKITSIIEVGLNTLKGVEELKSKSSNGYGSITLEFSEYVDIDAMRFEVSTTIRQLYKKLPKQASYPTITVNKPNDDEQNTFLSYSINAQTTPSQIQEVVKTLIEPDMTSISGIDRIEVYGAEPIEYVLKYDFNALNSLHISKGDIITAIQNYFSFKSLGNTYYNNDYITLAIHPPKKLNWHIPIKKNGDRIIYLDEVASVKQQEQEAQSYYRINGKNAITMVIYPKKMVNTIALAKAINKRLEFIKTTLPQDFFVNKIYDSTEYLKTELDKIYQRTIYTILILLLFIFLVSRSIEYLFVVVICLTVNIALAFLCYYLFSVEIQLYSLAGITISLGLIIDNSIVVIDHIKKQKNKNAFIPVFASTLTTIGALSVIHFLDNAVKINLIDFAMVIIINLSISLFIALFFIPALLEKINLSQKKDALWVKRLKNGFYDTYKRLLTFLIKKKKWAIVVIILVFGIPFYMLPQRLEGRDTRYKNAYNNTIGNEWYKETIRPYIDRYLGGTSRLFSYYVFENANYGRNEETKIIVNASMEKGSTVHQMNEVFIEVENYLNQFHQINQFTSYVASGQYARLEITFKPDYERSLFPFLLKSRLTDKAIDFEGLKWSIYGVGRAFISESLGIGEPINFSIEAKGYNYGELNSWCDSLSVLLSKHPRVKNIVVRENSKRQKIPSYKYTFKLKKEKLALNNISPKQAIDALKNKSLSKFSDFFLNINNRYTSVRLETKHSKNFDIWHIKNTPVHISRGSTLIKDIFSISKQKEDENIYKKNQEYIRKVDFKYTGAARTGGKYLNTILEQIKAKTPLGYTFEKTNLPWFIEQEEKESYTKYLFLIMVIIYFICSILFENLKQAFIILSIIPISFIGVFVTFYWFGFNFDQGGLASFVLLSGITVNASILIIDQFNTLQKRFTATEKLTLYLEAFKQKIFPILLTIFSTILGFIPFIKDGQQEVFWFALGVGTIGGLLVSLIGILIYLPLFALKK